jgi:predicted transcriptional regulator
MPPALDLSDLQLATIRVLWDRGEATTAEVHKALRPSRGLAVTTVATLLRRLEERGLVAHRSDGRAFVYRALLSEGEARRSAVSTLLRSVFRNDAPALFSQLVSHDTVDDADLAEMRKLLADSTRARRGKTR